MRVGLPLLLLLLHDVYLPWWFAVLIWGTVFSFVAQGLLLLVRNYRGSRPSRRPPVPFGQMWRIAAGVGVIGGIAAGIASQDSGAFPITAMLATITAMGVESIVWLVFPWNRARDAEASSCDQCRLAAESGGVAPLDRVAHNADGPRFLYRCAKCHSYWEKDVKGTRPISVLRVRQDFPAAVI
jgi:hypothetical protein